MALAQASAVVRAVPVFGRGSLRITLSEILDRAARDGRGKAILLVGDEGIGKSTLLREVVALARERGFAVAEARGRTSELPRPYALLHDLLRSLPHSSPSEKADRLATVSLSLLWAPFVAAGDHGGPPSGSGSDDEASAADATRLLDALSGPVNRVEQHRAEFFDAITAYLSQQALSSPLLIAIDDLHWADEHSIRYLRELCRSVGERPIVCIGAVSSEHELPPRPAELVARTRRVPEIETLEVPALTLPESAEYVRYAREGRALRPDIVKRWYADTGGNPSLLEQLARRPSSATRAEHGAGAPDLAKTALARRLDELARTRLQRLATEDRRVLALAAVFGHEFDFATLELASGIDEDALSERLDRLVRHGFLREKSAERFEFVREPLREEAYPHLAESRRVLHRRVAYALESRQNADGVAVYELARQFYLAQVYPKALEYNRRAANLASSTYAYRSAGAYLERALECALQLPNPDPVTVLHLRIELGRVFEAGGELVRAVEVLDTAVRDARADPKWELELALALIGSARVRGSRWENGAAREMAKEAEAILERRGHRRGMLVVHGILGRVAWCEGDFGASERHERLSAELAEELGDRVAHAHALVDWANTLLYMGDESAPRAEELYSRAVDVFAEIRAEAGLARALMDRALLFHSRNRMDEAFRDLRAAIQAAERAGSYVYRVYSYLNLAQFRVEAHDTSDVRALLASAAELNDRLGDQLVPQQVAMIEGMLAEEEGRWADAASAFERALEMARKLEMLPDVVEMHLRLARLGIRSRDWASARKNYDAAMALKASEIRADLASSMDEIRQGLERAWA
jgi:tetratricopeptide (TPR) repeat protein